MNRTLAHTKSWPSPANAAPAAPPTPSLRLVTADTSGAGMVACCLLAVLLSIVFFGWTWHVAAAVAAALAVLWTVALVRERIWNRLHEPVCRLSATEPELGGELIAQFTLYPKSEAVVTRVRLGLKSIETRGEDRNTKEYEGWTSPPWRVAIGPAPLAVEQPLRLPSTFSPQWSKSNVSWSVTLCIEVDGGLTVRRRYAIHPRAAA